MMLNTSQSILVIILFAMFIFSFVMSLEHTFHMKEYHQEEILNDPS
jgi:hypothetical protein